MGGAAIAPGTGLCPSCDQVFYSAALLGGVGGARCERCDTALAPVPTEPFGPGTLYVPEEWLGDRRH